MGEPWKFTEPDLPALIDEIIRSAVAFGYRRGVNDAVRFRTQSSPPAALPEHELELAARERARGVAEEFLRKVYVEQVIADDLE